MMVYDLRMNFNNKILKLLLFNFLLLLYLIKQIV